MYADERCQVMPVDTDDDDDDDDDDNVTCAVAERVGEHYE